MSNPEVDAFVEAGVARIAMAIGGLPAVLVSGVVDLIETIVASHDVASALARAKQNALADAEDAVAIEAADALLKAEK